MDMKQAMVERRMVRKYTDKPIPTEIVRRINGRVSDVNAEYRTDIELVRDDAVSYTHLDVYKRQHLGQLTAAQPYSTLGTLRERSLAL